MMPRAPFERFLNSPLAEGMTEQTREALARECRPLELSPRDRIPPDRVNFVASGYAKFVTVLDTGQEHVASFVWPETLAPQAPEGEGALVALTQCLFLTFKPETFLKIVSSDSNAARNVSLNFSAQVRDLSRHAAIMARLSAEDRIIVFLNILAAERGVAEADGVHVYLPMSRADIADHLGLTIETVSRCMTHQQRSGLILCPSRREVVLRSMTGCEP